EAELAGTRIALEPYQSEGGAEWTIASTIPDALELIAEAGGSPALGLQFDTWHLWNSPTVLDDVAAHNERIAGVHVSDVRRPERTGVAPLPPRGRHPAPPPPHRRPRPRRRGRLLRPGVLPEQRTLRKPPPGLARGRPRRRARPPWPRSKRRRVGDCATARP